MGFRRTDQLAQTIGITSSAPTTVTSSASSANTFGSYAELISSTPFDCYGIDLNLSHIGATTRDRHVAIAIGTGGAEVDFITIPFWSCGGPTSLRIRLPYFIKAGSRIAAKMQATATSQQARVWGHLLNGPIEVCSHFTTLQLNAADSGGLGIDPGGSANTFSAWNELVAAASLTSPVSKLWPFLGWRANGTPTADTQWTMEIGTGPATEVPILSELWHGATAGSTPGPSCRERDVNIPLGTRLSARVSCSITDATDRLTDVAVILGHYGGGG